MHPEPARVDFPQTYDRGLSLRAFAYGATLVALLVWVTGYVFDYLTLPSGPAFGAIVDTYDRVPVYYNGRAEHSAGRHLGEDGYNLGLKWQNAEFVKRYYLERYAHRMPDTYGYPKDFFDPRVPDGELNPQRGLVQFTNPSPSGPPRPGDLIVFGAGPGNRNGHVAIVSQVRTADLEIVQQNPGLGRAPRRRLHLAEADDGWRVAEGRVLGWLRKG